MDFNPCFRVLLNQCLNMPKVNKGIRRSENLWNKDSLILQNDQIWNPHRFWQRTLGYCLVTLGCRSIWWHSRAVGTNLPSSWHKSITFLGASFFILLENSLEDPQTSSSQRSWDLLSLSRHSYHPEAMFRSMAALSLT